MQTVWVSVGAGESRVDLALPVALTVAEVEPDVCRLLGAEGRLATLAGPLDPALAVGDQVADGSLLILAGDPARECRPVHEDPADDVAALPARELSGVDRAVLRRLVALAAAALGLVGIAAQGGWLPAGALLMVAGLVAVAWRGPVGLPLVVGGASAVCVATVAARTGLPAASLHLGLGCAAVLVAGAAPALGIRLALGRAYDDPLGAHAPPPTPTPLVAALVASAALPLALAAWSAPGLGAWGSFTAGAASVLCLLRARRHRARAEAGAWSGVGALGLGVLAVASLEQAWVVAAGAAVTLSAVLPAPTSLLVRRLLDAGETALLLVIPVSAVWACGVAQVLR